jgi:zinc transport system substrate-binding protein
VSNTGRNYFYPMHTIKRHKSLACWLGIAGCLVLLPGRCSKPADESFSGISVFVSIPPQKYFVEKIGGDYCRVQALIPAGASPHTFEPKPRQLAELAKADCYFSVGVEMERVWLPKLLSIQPALPVIPTDSGIEKVMMEEADGDMGHNGGDGHDHHEGADPHIWLSPDLVKLQASIILRALQELDTAHAVAYQEQFDRFMDEIDSLKLRITGRLRDCGAGKHFMAFHPSWGYFARAFGLHQIAVEVEGKEPGMRQLGEIVSRARREGVKSVLVQPGFSAKTASVIAHQIGGRTLVADPLAEDWAENLERVAEVLCSQ